MNFNAGNVVMFGIGAILLYSAIKDKNPKEVIQDAFTQNNSGNKPGAKGSSSQAPNRSAPPTRPGEVIQLDPDGHARFVEPISSN